VETDLAAKDTDLHDASVIRHAGWLLVHRHAAPLVRAVPIEQIFAGVDG